MFTLAITGGLGAGKSTAARHFAARGAHVIALDEVARQVLAGDPHVLGEVVARFGAAVVGEDWKLDRALLAQAAFGDADTARALNAIVHPAAIRATKAQLAELAASPEPPALVVLEIPLLAEAPELLDAADSVLAISAPAEMRVARAMAKGMSEADARRRIAVQATDAERASLADAVIANDSDAVTFEAAVSRYYEEHILPRLESRR